MTRGRAVILGLSIPIYALLGYLMMLLSVHGPEILVPMGPIYFVASTSTAVFGYRKLRSGARAGGTLRYLGVCVALALLAPLLVFIATTTT